MTIFNKLLDMIEANRKDDCLAQAYYHVFRSMVLRLQAEYACKSLEEAGY